MKQIYLDYNATTPIAPSVLEAMMPFLNDHFGNPSSSYARGRATAEAIEDARMRVASLLAVNQEEVIFTGGGSEANNLAIKGTMLAGGNSRGGHIVISAFEHSSVALPARFLERMGFELTLVDPDPNGVVQPEAVEAAITSETRLVSVMHANNEIGTIQPIKRIASVCRAHDVLLHTDAAQSFGKISTLLDDLDVDLLTIAAHKLYGPKGVGALFVREGLELEPVIHGAGQEFGLRAGTENTAGIVGLGKACSIAAKCLDEASERMEQLRDRLAAALSSQIPHLRIHGLVRSAAAHDPQRLTPARQRTRAVAADPRTVCLDGCGLPQRDGRRLAHAPCDWSLGAEARGTVRLSVGWYTSQEDIDRAAGWIVGAWEAMT